MKGEMGHGKKLKETNELMRREQPEQRQCVRPSDIFCPKKHSSHGGETALGFLISERVSFKSILVLSERKREGRKSMIIRQDNLKV